MNKIKILIISIVFLIISTISYAQQQPPIKDVCIYPVYTSQQFDIAWDHSGTWTYKIVAVHYITNEEIQLIITPNLTANIKIDKSGLWEIRIIVVEDGSIQQSSTLNTDTCTVDGLPQKWVVYTSPAPPGDPIFD